METDVTRDMSPDAFVELVEEMVNRRRLCDHPFLDRLERGEVTRGQIDKICYQMMYYYNNSVRNIGSCLMHNMDRGARTAIMENLIDEETEQRCGYAAHYVIALDFAAACGYDRKEIEQANLRGEIRPHPALEEGLEDVARFGTREEPALAMAAGMVGAESLLPDFYIRLVPALKPYGFSDKELDIFIVHIEGDLEHAAEGRKLIRAYADTPERRQRFYAICEYVRDRLWEAWDGVFQAADLDLPQAVHPRKPAPPDKARKAVKGKRKKKLKKAA